MRALRVCSFCSAGIIAGMLLCAYLVAAESQPAAAKAAAEAPNLQQRVTTLEEKVARLEKQLAEQVQRGNLVPVPPTATPGVAPPMGTRPAPVAPQLQPGIPPNAVPQTFNGQTYYIVPLAKDAVR